ncbi:MULTISPECIES: ABC transporter ATP-binding protein [unclassified Methanoculleus]|uniref:metal ABC transporter ATP-binding protein n=1 Tax=unclassified Methanoculleus TaxID=2619537 RepID=UPI0025E5B144|nr:MULTISPECIES: ABC transporter ATP-binding protein [unclassified Methanoculleus]MCK9316971.1 ABC transporter ATP-binding protein [Methanoculleus sp.]MDD2252846.1 ABC transporter ATP-binding protein [Methanoculleus sp.]MDD2787189.1 ABC transporter ATP-binding protein [Methanoculleus sp.]MDD3215737.1 ABC transporter ATP-binding protein [Methanoculleus sp.]MDD4313504.1 ABC transporter ATP-binding protein [Methanoculleus sp.]
MSAPVIEVDDVWVRLRGQNILEGVSLAVYPDDVYAIIGPNGGGKTTLLRVILGLLTPSRGVIRILGGTEMEMRRYLGYVPQFRTFDFEYPITVREMVLSGRLGHITRLPRRYGEEDRARTEEALDTMQIAHLADRQIRNLSGGEQQRVIIARALVGDPKVLLLDEPTVYVDAPTEAQFYEILDGLRDRMAIVLVTHDIGVLPARVTRVACLNRRLYTHDTNEITPDMLEAAYRCPVDLIAHGIPHRVLPEHSRKE